MNSTTSEVAAQHQAWASLHAAAAARIRVDAADADAWQLLSRAAWESGRNRAALDAYRRVVTLQGRTAPHLVTLGRIAMHAMEFDEARTAFDEAERLAPDGPELLAARAMLCIFEGRFDAAEQYCRRCLSVRPDYVPAYTALARLNRGRFTDVELAMLSRIAAQTGAPVDFRIPALFALAQGFEARGNSGLAFDSLLHAHALARERNRLEGRPHDCAAMEDRTRRLQSLFVRMPPAVESMPSSTPTPVFIVGMPRSGTTLVESVLAAHSRVRACGERPDLPHLLSLCLAWDGTGRAPWSDADTVAGWRQSCLAGAGVSGGYMTDKQPLNFEALGLIAHLFPEARVIHVRRDPVETCLSIFRNEFSKFWTFTDRLDDLGHYYGQYAQLMAHWQQVLGDRFTTLQYEEFAGDFERQAPQLLAACGLEWEAQCLRFQEVVRVIPTFSAVSARGQVSVQRGAADRYRAYLAPLRAALERAGVDLDTGSLLAAPAKPL